MATIVHSDSAAAAFRRAGESMLRRFANATARVLDFEFGVNRREDPGFVGMEQVQAQSELIVIVAHAADVAAAPVELYEEDLLEVDGADYRIVRRTEQADLGHVTFTLGPCA
jgi:hypothetical protein